jgi:hypothetical protein
MKNGSNVIIWKIRSKSKAKEQHFNAVLDLTITSRSLMISMTQTIEVWLPKW